MIGFSKAFKGLFGPNPEETKFEYRVIDWDKVTTVEDVVNILSNIGLTRRVKVGKVEWEDPKWARLLGDKVYTETWTKYGYVDDGDKK